MRWERQEEPDGPSPDLYSRLNPDSPWRWAAVVCVPILFLIPAVARRLEPNQALAGIVFVLTIATLIPIPIMWFKVGSPIAYWVAAWKARKVGGKRISSHPRLVRAVRIIGPVMFLTGIGARLAFRRPFQEHETLAMMGVFVTAWGWERPWDLRVVERDADAEVRRSDRSASNGT